MMIQSCGQDGQTLEQGYSPPKGWQGGRQLGRVSGLPLKSRESEGTGLIKEDKFPVSVGAVPGATGFSLPPQSQLPLWHPRWPRGEGLASIFHLSHG